MEHLKRCAVVSPNFNLKPGSSDRHRAGPKEGPLSLVLFKLKVMLHAPLLRTERF